MTRKPFRHRRVESQPQASALSTATAALGILGMAAVVALVPIAHGHKAPPPAMAAFKAGTGQNESNAFRIVPAWPASAEKDQPCPLCGIVESISIAPLEMRVAASGKRKLADEIVGSQLAKNRGDILLTVISLSGRPYAGHVFEQNADESAASSPGYLVKVRMADRSIRLVTQVAKPEFAVGDHVRVTSGAVITT